MTAVVRCIIRVFEKVHYFTRFAYYFAIVSSRISDVRRALSECFGVNVVRRCLFQAC